MRFLSFSELMAYWACPRLSSYRQCLPLSPKPLQSQRGIHVHEQLHRAFCGLPTDISKNEPELWACYQQVIAPYEMQDCRGYSEWECVVPLVAHEIESPVAVSGRLDRIYVQEQTLHIIDWKTGSSQKLSATSLQLRFYAWLVWLSRRLFRFSGITKVVASAHFLEEDHTETFTLSEQNIAQEQQFFILLIQNYLQQSSQTPPGIPDPRSTPEGVWCTMCEYQGLCPEGKYHA